MFFPGSRHTVPGEAISHMQVPLSDCRTDSVIRGELEEGNHSPQHCGNYARCVPSQEEVGQNKNPEYEQWREED